MEIRSVSVHLDADVAGYIAKMKLAGEATDRAFSGADRHIGSTATSLSRVDTEARKADTSLTRLGSTVERDRVKVDAGLRSIDKFSGRLRLLVAGAAAVGPAIVPIAAVAIPAVTALGGSVVSLGLGVGVTELAFHGLGSALQKFNTAAAMPTATNIAAAQKAMDALPPSAQALVLQLHQLTPLFDKLREDAAGGFVPGVSDGLQSLLADTPLVRSAIRGISSELGQMARESGQALASDQWRPFIRFAGQEAPVALHTLGAATGDVAHGLSQILMDFGPLNRDVDQGILKLAQDFDRWATSLGRTKDFQSFIAYIEANGPKVIGLLGDTAHLFGDIVAAAAPLGGPTLDALDLLVNALDLLANSPLATPLLALGQLYAVVKLVTNGYLAMKTASIGAFGSKYLAGTQAAVAGLFEVTSAQDRARLSAQELEQVEAQRSAQNRATLLKGGAALAGFTLLASGVADKAHLANTATLALAGSFAGPYGAAAGAAIGLTIDMAHANDSLVESERRVKAAFDATSTSLNFKEQAKDLGDLQSKLAATRANMTFPDQGLHPIQDFEVYAAKISDLFTHTTSEASAAVDKARESSTLSFIAFRKLFQGLGGKGPIGIDPTSMSKLQQTVTRAQPAMEALGITVGDLQAAAKAGDGSLGELTQRIVDWINKADSAAGRSHAVADAFNQMSDASLTTSDRVDALTSSLDALLDPMLQLGSARDAFQKGLNDLDQSLAKNNKTLRGNSDAAIQNRGAVRDLVSNLKATIEAQAKAGKSSQTMAATLRQGRQAIIAQGQAAGLNKQQIQNMINTMGLTPKLIKTVFQSNAAQAARDANSVQAALNAIERVVNVHINVTRFTNANLADVNTPTKRAGGGLMRGPGGPTDDQIPAYLSNGEYVIRAAAVQRYGLGFMHRVNAARFADGGFATHVTSSPGGLYAGDSGLGAVGRAANDTTNALKGLRGESDRLTKQLDAERQQRQAIAQQRQQLISTVAGNFRSQIFGVTPDTTGIWGRGGAMTDPEQILRHDIRGARQYAEDIARLRRRGLRRGALAEVDTLDEAEQALGLSKGELRRITHDYAVRQRASQAAGVRAGDLRYGEHLASMDRRIETLHHDLVRVNASIKHHEKEAAKHSKDNADHITKGINGAARTASRRAR